MARMPVRSAVVVVGEVEAQQAVDLVLVEDALVAVTVGRRLGRRRVGLASGVGGFGGSVSSAMGQVRSAGRGPS